MNRSPDTHTYTPRITFQDTNVVGNVYFLTFFRWQAECRDQWLRVTHPELWTQILSGDRKLLVTHWSTRFEDPLGATIGDDVEVLISGANDGGESVSLTTEVFRHNDENSVRIASGTMMFTAVDELTPPHNDHPMGPSYSFEPNVYSTSGQDPLELLGWQGKCRELFLADHTADTLRRVAARELILQTTTASLDLVRMPPKSIDHVRVEMRLESLKCGQMSVRFDYLADLRNGTTVRFAKGSQKLSSKRQSGQIVAPCPLPTALLIALRGFTDSEQLLAKITDILSFASGARPTVSSLAKE